MAIAPRMIALLLVALLQCRADIEKRAYVSLIYGSDYALPVRVMHNSLRRSGTPYPLVVLTAPSVSPEAIEWLRADGIQVMPVSVLKNPYATQQHYESRFSEVMTKLTVFSLSQFDKVVFLDADTLVFENLDDMFSCGDFCAAFVNPCIFNSGVMVIKPSAALFDDMRASVQNGTISSYDGGDQGMLNVYYRHFLESPLFHPGVSSAAESGFFRLPFNWHLDHTIFYPRMSWPECPLTGSRAKVVEFIGLAFAKPWFWYTHPLLDVNSMWLEERRKLPRGDPESRDLAMQALVAMPVTMLVFLYIVPSMRNKLIATASAVRVPYSTLQLFPSDPLGSFLVSIVVGITCFIISARCTLMLIPKAVYPSIAWAVFLEWLYLGTVVLFGCYCRLQYQHGLLPTQKLQFGDARRAKPMHVSLLCLATAMLSNVLVLYLLSLKIYSNVFQKLGVLLGGLAATLVILALSFAWVGREWCHAGHQASTLGEQKQLMSN